MVGCDQIIHIANPIDIGDLTKVCMGDSIQDTKEEILMFNVLINAPTKLKYINPTNSFKKISISKQLRTVKLWYHDPIKEPDVILINAVK